MRDFTRLVIAATILFFGVQLTIYSLGGVSYLCRLEPYMSHGMYLAGFLILVHYLAAILKAVEK